MGQRGSPGATERCPWPPKSAFFVKLSEPLPKPFQPVVFKEALYNQQDHFNLTTGVFSCTTPGVYNFAFDNELFQRSVKIGLMRNGIRVRWKQAQAKDSHKHALGTVIVQLEKEDKTKVSTFGTLVAYTIQHQGQQRRAIGTRNIPEVFLKIHEDLVL
ncbi:hypothetical protein EI555_010340 [Monodon monoceros]|uniref:C1q domain-containing protein n=1 Tax=Monodon monoceros TaxID=40151 RepID=A0A4U1FA38_MONMO|nr:hypothetical protein EI555_010340 [Monodon monoceros]